MARVTLTNVRKTFPGPGGGVEAVKGVSLDIADGEFVVLVGPSGCGKSTTLRMVAGLEEITEGEIRIGERVVNTVHPKDRDIAMVFQNYALYPHMTVRQNMAFGLKLRRYPKKEIRRRVDEAARMLGLEDLLDRKPRALSGGQRQRVAVGRAIVREPKAFLFDEPLSNLDARLRTTTRAELKALHHRLKTTTVYVTHDQEEAMTLGDRIVVMRDGEALQVGRPLEVYNAPATRFVGGFIGTPPMNMLQVRIEVEADSVWLSIIGKEPRQRLRLTEADSALLRAADGRTLELGLRPQFMFEGEGRPGATLEALVDVVEPLGDQMDVFARLPGAVNDGAIVARIRARPGLAPGQTVRLGVEMERVHLFEAGETGANLLLGNREIK
ncbi:MAG: ABC transporter ATP-binding protein [Phycisphaerales bacterium JB039]